MDARTQRNLNVVMADGILATPWTILSLPAGFIISAMLNLYYGINPGMFGLIVSMPAWANASQIVLMPFLAKFFTARDMTIGMSWLNLGLWILLAAILPFLPDQDQVAAGQIFLIFFILASLSASLLGLGWLAWVQRLVPSNSRGGYFGRRNRYIALTTLVFFVLCMTLLNWLPGSVRAYQLILAVGAIMRFGSVLSEHLTREDPADSEQLIIQGRWLPQLRLALRHPGFLAFVGFNVWVNFWINLTGPFGAVYVYEQLGMSPGQFAVMNILSTLTGAITMPLWGRVMDKHGCVPVIGLGLLLWQCQSFLWAVLTPETTWLLYPMFLWVGSVAAAFLLGSFSILLKIIPLEAKTAGISLNLAATSVAAGIAPILAGLMLNLGQSMGWSEVLVYRTGFILSPMAIILSLLFLKRIHEPEADPRYSTVWGATRMVRQSMHSAGLSALAKHHPRGPQNSPPAPLYPAAFPAQETTPWRFLCS